MKKQIPILSKIYLVEFLSAIFCYVVGLLVMTPEEGGFKYFLRIPMMIALIAFGVIGSLALITVMLLMYFSHYSVIIPILLFSLMGFLGGHAIAFYVSERKKNRSEENGKNISTF